MHRDTQVEMESAVMHQEASIEGEESSVTMHEQDDDIPGAPSEPPPPLTSLDKPTRPEEPPSVELEGEKGSQSSCDDRPTSAEATASGASFGNEDPRNQPKMAQNKSDRV